MSLHFCAPGVLTYRMGVRIKTYLWGHYQGHPLPQLTTHVSSTVKLCYVTFHVDTSVRSAAFGE